MNRAIAIIPARYASTRLPGKPLLAETGKPLIVHVIEQARRAARLGSVIVATDDARIAEAVDAHGGRAMMTRDDHANGTSRIAEVAAGLPAGYDTIVNVQGDEPEIDPKLIDLCVDVLHDSAAPMATVASPFAAGEDPTNPNVVKVVLDQRGYALYFSRALIPHDRDGQAGAHRRAASGAASGYPLKHVGLYAYRRDFLERYVNLPATPAEQAEKLEQLRAIEHGFDIAVAVAPTNHVGIDTPEQYAAFVRRYAGSTG